MRTCIDIREWSNMLPLVSSLAGDTIAALVWKQRTEANCAVGLDHWKGLNAGHQLLTGVESKWILSRVNKQADVGPEAWEQRFGVKRL
jgi:hypothetical protein